MGHKHGGRYRQVVVIQKFSLVQVRLYFQSKNVFFYKYGNFIYKSKMIQLFWTCDYIAQIITSKREMCSSSRWKTIKWSGNVRLGKVDISLWIEKTLKKIRHPLLVDSVWWTILPTAIYLYQACTTYGLRVKCGQR